MKPFLQVLISKLIFLCIILTNPQNSLKSQSVDWNNMRTVEELYSNYPDRMKDMLSSFNLELQGLEQVNEAHKAGNIEKACKSLLEYYKNSNTSQHLRVELPIESSKTSTLADSIMRDIYTFQTVTGKVPRIASGHLKWDHNGPEDDIEWAWALNRHYPVNFLLQEYFNNGNPKYIEYIDQFIKDWIIQSNPYPAVKSNTAMWRGLEVSFRVKMWAKVFYSFLHTDYISPATQLLILSSLADHAHYARNFHGHTNWLTMEMTGLATVASAWPELKESKDWMDYTSSAMTESLKEQVYPDGTQTELTTHYHRVALINFYLYYTICKNSNISLPRHFADEIEKMWNYLALIMRPDGNALLNNDADLDYNKKRIYDVAKEYNRQDWLYIASNGLEGKAPSSGPSFIFPYAGHMVSRSGYELDDHWSFFDIGPWGSGHQHNDKLHLSIAAFGQDFLVDAGRFAYRGEVAKKFRGYAKGSAGHNVILIDGAGQKPGPKLTEKPLSENHYKITPEFDYAWESFDQFKDLEGTVNHSRAVLYVRDEFWVVVDKVATDRPREIQTLWHWHPRCVVTSSGNHALVGTHQGGSLQLIPVGSTNWKVDMIKGQEKPEIQGWYSEQYNQYEPNMASIFSTKIESDDVIVWLLMPSKKSPVKVEAEIVSQSTDGVRIKVTDPSRSVWTMNIPFANSDEVRVDSRR